jgi:alanine dehydrogenase
MIIAVLKEVKRLEGRVALVPDNVVELVKNGHEVLVQKEAGLLSCFSDEEYVKAGAEIVETTKELMDRSDLVLKVKEPTIEEVKMMKPGQIFWGYLHLAAIPETLQAILDQKIIALGFETLELPGGALPLLAPMSEIAGRLASQNGAHLLRFDQGGRGILIGGTTTVDPARVMVIGSGVVGRNATDVAVGMGAHTTVLDVSPQRLDMMQKIYGDKINVELSTPENIEQLLPETDLVVGAVLIVGEKAPKLITEDMVKTMKKGSVIVDVSVDQGGCVETSEVTTHDNPYVVKHGVLHYGVANMPGSVPVTSTLALNHASFPYTLALANEGLAGVCESMPEMKSAINCQNGEIVHQALKDVL